MIPLKQASHVRPGSPILAGLLYAFISMGVSALLASVILILADQSEETLPAYAYAIHGISTLSGSFVSGKRSGKKGWYYGGLLGILYSLIVLIIGFLSFDRGLDWSVLIFAAAAIIAGAIGGIAGVNMRK